MSSRSSRLVIPPCAQTILAEALEKSGDVEELPFQASEVDMVLMHQTLHHALHPERALAEAWRVLRPGGRIVLLDLLKHEFEAARELYADVWLGFSQVELLELLRQTGFQQSDISVVDHAAEPPHFETIMAIAEKPLWNAME